jgi:NAD dependent epimerase/dehydratase family enzyme
MLGEMSTLLLDGQNAVPRAAMAHGYRFVHPALSGALADLARLKDPKEVWFAQNTRQNRL